jgi:hypothetical protein
VSFAVAAQDSRPSGSLVLSRKALASSASCRFIPAHCNRLVSSTIKFCNRTCDHAGGNGQPAIRNPPSLGVNIPAKFLRYLLSILTADNSRTLPQHTLAAQSVSVGGLSLLVQLNRSRDTRFSSSFGGFQLPGPVSAVRSLHHHPAHSQMLCALPPCDSERPLRSSVATICGTLRSLLPSA